MKVKKSITITLNEEETLDLRSLLWVAKGKIEDDVKEGKDYNNPLITFADLLLRDIYL